MNAFESLCCEIGEFMDFFTEQKKIRTSVWHIAYIRQRYDHEKEWEYTYEPFIYHFGSECDFAMDWWEGQQNVELLGVYSLDYVMDEYRRN